MFDKIKMSYEVIRKKMGSSINKTIKENIKTYSQDELRRACLDKDKAYDLASKIYHRLPDSIKSHFTVKAKEDFIEDIVSRLLNVKDTKKGRKKLFGV